MEDLYFQLFLGAFWLALSVVLFVMIGNAYHKSNPQRKR
jgi:hypothetical protein